MTHKKLGIVGCGTIGSEIAIAVSSGQIGGYLLSGLCDTNRSRANRLQSEVAMTAEVLELEPLIDASDILLEATNKAAMPQVTSKALGAGKAIVVMSVGGLADAPELMQMAEEGGGELWVPSGAICGVDGILAAREADLRRVRITTTKNPKSLSGAPLLQMNGVSVEDISEAKTVFEGSAREAIEAFPANANVSITLGVAGLDVDRTEVRIVADPSCTRTMHEIVAEGDFGSIRTITEGNVAPSNPRTGYLAILSAKATLRKISCSSRVGT